MQGIRKHKGPDRKKVKTIETYVTQITSGKEDYMRRLLQPLMPDFHIWVPTKPYAFSHKIDGEKMVRFERSILFPGYLLTSRPTPVAVRFLPTNT